MPFTNNYTDTLYFANKTEQLNFFDGRAVYTFTAQSYQRVRSGVCRLNIRADNIYDCNYMMFQNTNFGTKWFYAFITSVEYISNDVSEITYELDVMQTWLTDFTLNMCFVEREHSETDVVGDNILPENIDLGEYVSGTQEKTNLFNDYVIVVATSTDSDGDAWNHVPAHNYGGIFAGVEFKAARFDDPDTITDLQDYINRLALAGESDAIISMFMMPTTLYNTSTAAYENMYNAGKSFTSLNGYTPKNNKLFTFPYNFLYVHDGCGNSANFRYEMFDSSFTTTTPFMILGVMSCNPSMAIVPLYYGGEGVNWTQMLRSADFPQCAFSVDSFRAWLGQNAGSLTMGASVALSAITGGLGATAGGLATVATGVGATSTVASICQEAVKPPRVNGNMVADYSVAHKSRDFYFVQKCITPEYAKCADDYFTKYGYSCQKVKVPNISSRPKFNYTKTRDCSLRGNIPADDSRRICDIFNNGITFWKSAYDVGNYNVDNAPVGGD